MKGCTHAFEISLTGKRPSTWGAAAAAPRTTCGWGRVAYPPWLQHFHEQVTDASILRALNNPDEQKRQKKEGKSNDLSLRWRSAELPWLRARGGTPHASSGTAALRAMRRGILSGRWGGGGGLGCLAWGRGRSEAVIVGLLRWGS